MQIETKSNEMEQKVAKRMLRYANFNKSNETETKSSETKTKSDETKQKVAKRKSRYAIYNI